MTELTQVCHLIARWLTEPEPRNPNWSPPTWQTFQLACQVHGVAPLLHEKLSEVGWLDPTLKAWLVEQYRSNTQRLAKMHQELQEILALFGQHDLPLLPLKGSILSAVFYGDAGLRPMADLDLLIKPQDFANSIELLAQLGYQPEISHWKHIEFSKPDNRRVVSKSCEHPDNPRKLEVHLYCRETFGGPTIDLTELMWQQAVQKDLLGEPALIVPPDILWLHLLVHTTYHMWQGKGRLIHLVDLAQLTPHLSDPLPLLDSVEARFIYPSLALLKRYFPNALDDTLLTSQQRRVSPAFQKWVTGLDLVNISYLNPTPPGPYLFKALKFSEGRPREVVQALRFALLPSLEEISLDHPKLARSKMPWLAYFLLPVDWVKRVVKLS